MSMVSRVVLKFAPCLDDSFGALIAPCSHSGRRSRMAWGGVFLAGLVAWVAFFRAGDDGREFYRAVDWPKEYQYFTVIGNAIRTGEIPWHTSIALQLSHPTDRFLAIPETLSLLAPQAQLLRWMRIKDFVLLNTLLMYAVGTFGWYRLSRYYRFPPLIALIGFVLFSFNGHIVSHIAAGHSMWSGYYWLPWFALILFKACERPMTFRDAGLLALVMGGIVLQGGCHLYIWCLLFLAFFFIANPLRHEMAVVAVLMSALLAAGRFAPAALVFNTNVHRILGFPSPRVLWHALVSRHLHIQSIFPWEFDYYIGNLGAWVLIALLVISLMLPACRRALSRYWTLAIPVVALAVLSFRGAPYFVLHYVPVPLLGTQRVPSRLAILPLVFVIAGACIAATNLLTIPRRGARVAVAAAGLLLAGGIGREIARHAMTWRMAAMEANGNFLFIVERSPLPKIVLKHDPAYVTAVLVSLVVSAASSCALVWWLWRTRRAALEHG